MVTCINGRKLVDAPDGFSHVMNTRPFRGKAYEYIVVASKLLGRDILPNEIVHHRNGLKEDNREDNLLVLDSRRTHAFLHGHDCDESFLKRTDNGAYTLNDKALLLLNPVCIECGTSVYKDNKHGLCPVCAREKRRKTTRPERDELARLVWEKPTTQLAKDFGVSDKCIGKWCKIYGISKPAVGYWQKHRKIIL